MAENRKRLWRFQNNLRVRNPPSAGEPAIGGKYDNLNMAGLFQKAQLQKKLLNKLINGKPQKV